MASLTTLPPDQLFLAYLPHVEKVAAHACRQKGLNREEAEEFISTVKLKIMEDDYAVLRKFKGKSSLKTYLTTVVRNFLQDHLNHIWGKWRPSAEAERLGPVAIQLDKLLSREGFSLNEACEILRTNHHVEASPQELEDLASRLPHRHPPRRMEGEEMLEHWPTGEMTPDQQVLAKETGAQKQQILQFLRDAMRQLPPEDSLLAKMSCDLKISQIARTLRLEQKPLYRRLQKIYEVLRQDLEGRGVRSEQIGELLSGLENEDEPRH